MPHSPPPRIRCHTLSALLALWALTAALLCTAGSASAAPPVSDGDRASRALAAMRDPATRTALVAAHRGGYASDREDAAPENSVANVEVAVRRGFDCYETDVRRTWDGHFVIVHDDTLDRETDGSGPVEELSLDEVLQLRKRYRDGSLSEARVATFEELLLAGRGRLLFKVDSKPGVLEHFDALARIVSELEMQEHVFFRVNRREAAQLAERFAAGTPRVEIMAKTRTPGQVAEIAALLSPATIEVAVEKDMPLDEGQRAAIRAALDRGIVVETHSYSDPAQWDELLEAGVRLFHTTLAGPTLRHLENEGWREGLE